MTNDKKRWLGAAIVAGAAGTVGGKLVQSGTIADDLVRHWYGQVGLSAVALAVAAIVLFCLDRAYRR